MINKIKDKLKAFWKKFKKWIIALLIPVAMAAPPTVDYIGEELKWIDFTDNLVAIEYVHKGNSVESLKDFKGVWKPTKEDFKEVYKYVYGYDLVPWQTMDGIEMSPLTPVLDDWGNQIIKPNGKPMTERINLIPQWEQEWNNNTERGEFKGNVLKELRKDVKPGMINHDFIEDIKEENITKSHRRLKFLLNLIQEVYAAPEFNDTFQTLNGNQDLDNHTPDTGSGWDALIISNDNLSSLVIAGFGADNLSASSSGSNCDGFGSSCGGLHPASDAPSGANYIVKVTQLDGDTSDDENFILCRIQDASNMYAVEFNEGDSALYSVDSGSWDFIDSASAIADGSVVELICNGTSISVEDDDSEIMSATDGDHTSTGKAGVGMGAVKTSTDDLSSQSLDNYSFEIVAAPPPSRRTIIWPQ